MKHYFKFTIRDRKFEGYKKIASLLFVINAVLFTLWGLGTPSISARIILITAAFILFVYAFYNWAYKKRKERSYLFVYLLMAGIWITETPYWHFSILFLLLLLLQYRMENNPTISLSPADIVITGLITRQYKWNAFNNIILKDGLLTLDFTDNKVLQTEPDWAESIANGEEEDYSEIEKEFNEFCREQLKK
jgi:hypothetical protein